jgi:hypothetical protein
MKKIELGKLYTSEELAKAAQHVMNPPEDGSVADAIMRDVTLPSLHRINETTGQENNAKYLAYALEYAVGTALRKGDKR